MEVIASFAVYKVNRLTPHSHRDMVLFPDFEPIARIRCSKR